MSDERCDFTGLRRFECACVRCRGPYVPPPREPQFSIREEFDPEYGPLVEVLKNGYYSIHVFDERFRFGIAKATMLLASIPEIRRFVEADDDQRLRFQAVETIFSEEFNVMVSLTAHPYFIHSSGMRIDEPFLHLQLVGSDVDLGVGYQKCKALCAVQNDLRSWLDRQGGWPHL